MNEPIKPDANSVLIVRLTNKLNRIITQFIDNELFLQMDTSARDRLHTLFEDAYTFSKCITSQLKELQQKDPESKLNLRESALCKVANRTKDLVDALVEYEKYDMYGNLK